MCTTFHPHNTNTLLLAYLFTTSMFTKLLYILFHSSKHTKKRPLSFLGLTRQGAHLQVRAPPQSSSHIMAKKHSLSVLLIAVLFNFAALSLSQSSEGEILLRFRESLKNTGRLSNWDVSKHPCTGWTGVICEKGHVWGLQLENMGLHGLIDIETLTLLKDLRSLSFMYNDFDGAMPNVTRLSSLKTIYLSNNKFSGEIPPYAFYSMLSLKKLHLASNQFTGPIPQTLAAAPKMMELRLENNQFEGQLPRFDQQVLKVFNASNNKLEGPIPSIFNNFPASSFSGNKALCGGPLQVCSADGPAPTDVSSSKEGGIPLKTIVIAAAAAAAALIAVVALVIILIRRKRDSHNQPEAGAAATAAAAAGDLNRMERGQGGAAAVSSEQGKQGVKLTFLKEDVEKFEMQDLLKASAEVLGSGVFGSTYKAALTGGRVMVVKRCKHMNLASKEDFNEHMRRLGRLNHQNVLSIVAFYYRKEEKLLVSQYAPNRSLAVRLHGNRSRDNPSLDWATRLKIVKGASKGLIYLHNELPSLTAAHGHLKSSNVLLDASYNPLLADYGLIPIVNKEHAEQHMIAYKSPDYKDGQRLTKKTDVWSLGILILETLTGRAPSNEVDLAKWVNTAIHDESGGAAVVFDREMAGGSQSHGEMMKLLNIGLSCCEADVEKRPEIKEVVDKIEEIKEKDFDDDFYSSYASESDIRSSRGLSEDFKSINI